jgi:hypothetical protein
MPSRPNSASPKAMAFAVSFSVPVVVPIPGAAFVAISVSVPAAAPIAGAAPVAVSVSVPVVVPVGAALLVAVFDSVPVLVPVVAAALVSAFVPVLVVAPVAAAGFAAVSVSVPAVAPTAAAPVAAAPVSFALSAVVSHSSLFTLLQAYGCPFTRGIGLTSVRKLKHSDVQHLRRHRITPVDVKPQIRNPKLIKPWQEIGDSVSLTDLYGWHRLVRYL